MLQMILGPVLGLFGAGIEKYAEYKQEKLKVLEREKDRQHDLAVLKTEADLADRRIKLAGDIKIKEVELASFGENLTQANKSLIPEGADLTSKQLSWIVAIEIFCKATRPCLTWLYQIFVGVIFGWSAWNLADAGLIFFNGEEFKEMFQHLVYSIIGLAEMAFAWWFGIRRMSKKRG